MTYLLENAELKGLMKVECLCGFLPSDRFYPTKLHISFANSKKDIHQLILVFYANKIKIGEFTQESVFMRRKPCAKGESKFDV